jgi:peptide/nickel transport system permease protein
MRVMDGLMSIPPILLAVALMALTRGSVGDVIVAITIAEIPRVSRLVRSVVLVAARPTFLSVTVLAVNLLGDRLRDALDPRTANGL